ncbi:MAG: thioesterase family protein [Balneolaceae bacterium]|nr:thioesterase family protein [Balneolaceae bacterium]
MEKPTYNKKSFAHWTELPVRFRDLDALNHVNNAVFNTYFEEARINFINEIPEFKKSMSEGKSFMLVHIELDYITPIEFHETILVGTSVEEYGNTSIKGFQAIYSKNSSELKAVAKTTGVWFDLEAKKPAALPEIEDRDRYLYKIPDNG